MASPDEESIRDEFFGKLTWTPTSSLLFAGSYRDSETDGQGESVCDTCAGTTSVGTTRHRTGYMEGTWLINDRSSLNFKFTDWANEGRTVPDNLLNFASVPAGDLNVSALDTQGQFYVPTSSTAIPRSISWPHR